MSLVTFCKKNIVSIQKSEFKLSYLRFTERLASLVSFGAQFLRPGMFAIPNCFGSVSQLCQ